MRRLFPLFCLVLITAACSDSGSSDTTAATTATAPPTTVTTTTSAAPSSSGGSVQDSAFEPIAGTPPAVFETFTSTATITMGFDDANIEVVGAGTWTNEAFECSLTMGLGGFGVSESVVATPETLWLDSGAGFEETSLFGSAQDIMASCPAAPMFWTDFTSEEFGRAVGDNEEFAGRDAIRLDLTELLGIAGGMGMIPDLEEATISEMVMWVDADTNVVLGLLADLEIDAAALGDLGVPGEAPQKVAMTMDLRLDQINDQSLQVELPNG